MSTGSVLISHICLCHDFVLLFQTFQYFIHSSVFKLCCILSVFSVISLHQVFQYSNWFQFFTCSNISIILVFLTLPCISFSTFELFCSDQAFHLFQAFQYFTHSSVSRILIINHSNTLLTHVCVHHILYI